MNTADILRSAAERVRHNWFSATVSPDGSMCASLAICDVLFEAGRVGRSAEEQAAVDAAHQALATTLGWCVGDRTKTAYRAIYTWNDAPDQTQENVALGLEYAAMLTEQPQPTAGRA